MKQTVSSDLPLSLLIYEVLLSRKSLTSKEMRQYERLSKGFIGENKLRQHLQKLDATNALPLFDCLFEVNGQEIQIDCLLLTAQTILLLEVKNYSGDYYLQNNKVYHLETNHEIYNPINQIERTEFLFNQLLREMRVDFSVRSFILFINRDFMLYGADQRMPMIFSSQVERFLNKQLENAGRMTDRLGHFAEQLIARQKAQSRYERLPTYSFSDLKRGLFCWRCHGELMRDGQLYFSCGSCAEAFHIDDVVMYALAQFQLLFPEEKITTKIIQEWCGGVVSRTFMSRFLRKSLEVTLNGGHTYYTFKNKRDPLNIIKEKVQLNFSR